jgi:ribosomal protein L11 methyltransferase
MKYTEIDIRLNELYPWQEVVIALLTDAGADSFWETDEGVKAYFESDGLDATAIAPLLDANLPAGWGTLVLKPLEEKNWNADWESQFQPVVVPHQLRIRAPFHPAGNEPLELIIQPKMSFGTGHHQTTLMMCEQLLKLNLEGRKVLDMGTGTGILAILALKRGAQEVTGIDNDPWSAENAVENAAVNQAPFDVILGDAHSIPHTHYSVILANINRNIILRDLPLYLNACADVAHADFLFSGFYTHDLPLIREAAAKNKLDFLLSFERENWCCAHFQKTNEV